MNTRQAIQPAANSTVLSLAFSLSRNRFVAGLSDGIRVYRADNCLTTHELHLPRDGGVAIAEVVDDRYIAYVGGGKYPAGKPSVVVFWDATRERAVTSFDLHEPIKGVRVNSQWMVVLLESRAVVFEHQQLKEDGQPQLMDESITADSPADLPKGPNRPHALYPTSTNSFALISLENDLLALPAPTMGQVQIIPLSTGSKRVLRAHTSSLRAIALSSDGTLLATASEQGTLIRVFDASTLAKIAEFRRGIDQAIIYNLAFSPKNRWLASTSDKGTLHIFDLRPPKPADPSSTPPQSSHRNSTSYAHHRLSSGAFETSSNPSSQPNTANLSPSQPASVQEYYGLRPPPPPSIAGASSSSTQGVAATALATLRATPFAPRIVNDVRSVASAPFSTGGDEPHWQEGGSSTHTWTTAPNGTRKRVRKAVLPLPGNPSGRPVKGIVTFAPAKNCDAQSGGDEDSATLYVLGGGSDPRWEIFELLPTHHTAEGQASGGVGMAGGWVLANKGFRQFMTRQYV